MGNGGWLCDLLMAVLVQSRASGSGMLVKSDLTLKDTSLWSSRICTFLIASMKLSVECRLCRELSVKGLRMLVKCFESC